METPSVFQVPPLDKRKRIPMKTIRRVIARHSAERFDPEQIILLGSQLLLFCLRFCYWLFRSGFLCSHFRFHL